MRKLFVTASNSLTSWWIDISSFTTTSLGFIDVYLVGCDNINFKSIIESDQLIIVGDMLIYKGSKKLTSNVTNEYYLEITDGTNIVYSNIIFFDSSNNISLTGDNVNLYYNTSGIATFTASGSGDITVDWGDGTILNYTLGVDTVVSHTYSTSGNYIAAVSNASIITDFTCNEATLFKIDNTVNFELLETLNIEYSSVSEFDFSEITTLKYVYVSNTDIVSFSGINKSDILILEADNTGATVTSTDEIATLYDTLVELSLQGNELSTIIASDSFRYYNELEVLNLNNNNLGAVPLVGSTGRNLASPIREWIISNNNISVGSQAEYDNLKPFLAGVTEEINLMNNSIIYDMDTILKWIASNNTNLAGLIVNVSGQSPITGISNSTPNDGIELYEIINGGYDYEVGDNIYPTDGDEYGTGAEYVVTAVDGNGTITAISQVTSGSGYNTVELGTFITTSGYNGLIEFYSPRVYLTKEGVELYTNSDIAIYLPDENALASNGYFLVDENENWITWL